MRKVTVTEQGEQERRDRWKALGIRTDIPYPARVYDYLLGGKDNFAADREMAELSLLTCATPATSPPRPGNSWISPSR